MTDIFEQYSDNLAKRIKAKVRSLFGRFRAYLKRLIFPLYLFPIKLVTYSIYYLIKFFLKFIISLIKIIIEAIIFPFRSLKNFLKAMFVTGVVVYMLASLIVIVDYSYNEYGAFDELFCGVRVQDKIQKSVVRVVGGFSEGTGFFIAPDQVLTNFHVIAGEPSPKVIFPSGEFVTVNKITGDKNGDLALLNVDGEYPDLVMPLPDDVSLREEEKLVAAGYPLGSGLTGNATLLKGRMIDFRKSRQMPMEYIQTDISLVEGMSGGPLTNQCGNVVGVNTMGLAGLSLFISADWAKSALPNFTDQDIAKIDVDPSASPEKAVEAFYTYLKVRRMEDGFSLLSREYLTKTDFKEWTGRFTDVIDVDVVSTKPHEDTKDTVFVKFVTKNWNDGEVDYHYYEGTWQTIKEDDVYKMLKSKIIEVGSPGWS